MSSHLTPYDFDYYSPGSARENVDINTQDQSHLTKGG